MKKIWGKRFTAESLMNRPSPLQGTRGSPRPKLLNASRDMIKLIVSKFKCATKPNEKELSEFIAQAANRSKNNFTLLSTCLKDLDYALTRYPTDESTLAALRRDKKRILLIYGKMNENFALKCHHPTKNTLSLLKGGWLFLDPDLWGSKINYGHLGEIGQKEKSLYKEVKYIFSIDRVPGPPRGSAAHLRDVT